MSEHNPNYVDYEYAHRPWEHETSFNDVLAEQLRRAPYFIASIVLHFVIILVAAGIMVLAGGQDSQPPQLVAAPPPPPPEVEEEEEPEEEIIEEIVEEPVIEETELEEVVEQETLEEDGDPDMNADAAFDSDAWNNDVGLGGGAGGKSGGRGGRGGKRGGTPQEAAVLDALKWLKDHQTPEGFWDADEFMLYDVYPDQPPSTGPGNAVNDVGLTGLALLAFLGNNHTLSKGKYKDVVSSGINWLKDVQDADSGLYGEEVGNPTLYNHSIATMAMGEAYFFSNRSPLLKRTMRDSVKVIINSQNPYGAWRYSLEPNGDNDTSITGWMIFALKTAEDGKLPINKQAYEGAQAWFDTMQDKNTGRVGYAWGEGGGGPGSPPSRPAHYIDKFPATKSEALTAVALLCQIFMTDTKEVKKWSDHENYEMMKKAADLIISKPPKWDENDGSIDMYYWYYGTFAMNQWGGKHWTNWKKAIEKALLPNQRKDTPDKKDNFYGSWDPAGPWGEEGGRVYSTAICALMLEVYYRYAQVLGAR